MLARRCRALSEELEESVRRARASAEQQQQQQQQLETERQREQRAREREQEQREKWQRTAADLRCRIQDCEAEMTMLIEARDKASRAVSATQEGALKVMRDQARLQGEADAASASLKDKERENQLLRDEMEEVEKLFKAELTKRNDALTAASQRADALEHDMSARDASLKVLALLALLVQKYKYWYRSTNTDAER